MTLRDTQLSQQRRTGSPGIDSHVYNRLPAKIQRQLGEKVVFPAESAVMFRYPQAKLRTWIHTFHNVQKLTQINRRLKDETYKYKTARGKKHRKILCDLGFGQVFLGMTLKM